MFREHHFAAFDLAAAAMADAMAKALAGRIAARGHAVLAVGGGRTPETVLPLLARAPCDWSLVTVTLTDERRVPPDDPASNEGLVRRLLLQGPAASASFFGLRGPAAPPPAADVVYLGFGQDGHVASLFPAGPELAADHFGLVEVQAPAPPTARFSLTLPSLLAAEYVAVLVSGAEKHVVYARAKAEAAKPELPLARVLFGDGADLDVFLADG